MKYLFFDVECSNCFNGVGKMCEFGYVLTDDNLHTLKADDIPMSPGRGRGSKFNLKGRKYEKDLELAYEYEFYFEQPEFNHFYKQIKSLMEDSDTICFAYSMNNDIAHLYHACKRYGLEPIKYTCYDVQKLVAAYLDKKGQMSLHNACKEIVGPSAIVQLHEHLSRDDAQMEKLIFETICMFSKKKPQELLEESKSSRVDSIKHMSQRVERLRRKRMKEEGHNLYRSLIASEEELDLAESKGKRYNVSGELKCHLPELNNVIEIIKSRGGIFSNHLSKTDYFIVFDEKNKEEIINTLETPLEGEILTYQEFLDLTK